MSGDKCAQGMYMDKGLNSEHIIRGKGDHKNIMTVVQSKTEKGYRLATKQGILLGSYTRNQFEPIS